MFALPRRLSLPALLLATGCAAPGPPPSSLEPGSRPSGTATAGDPGDEIRGLMRDPAVQQALQHVEDTDSQTMADLVTLTEIPAPPFQEEERARRFVAMMREIGIDSVHIDEEGNVVGLRRGRAGTGVVAISGHLDTVFPEGTNVSVTVRGDTLFAPGIGDDTRGLAAVLAVLRAMNQAGIQTEQDVLFIGTVGEEGLGDLRGVKHLFRSGGPRIDSFISVDGTGASGITHEGLGSHRYRVTFKGPGGHSWGAFGLANPAHALGRAVRYFEDGADAATKEGPRTSYNVGRIGGGTSVNSVPFEAWMEIDMRSESQASLGQVDALLKDAVRRAVTEENELRRSGPPLTVDVDLIGERPSGEIPTEALLVRRATWVTQILGLEPRLGRSSTDSNIPISLGIPAITIGGGGVGLGAHSPAERFVNRDGALGVQRALLILLAQAGLARTS